jgi:hypothetical protein
MELTLGLIRHRLQSCYGIETLAVGAANGGRSIKGFQLYDGKPINSEVLYVLTQEELLEHPWLWNGSHVITTGSDADDFASLDIEAILVPSEIGIKTLLNLVQNIFLEFNEWEITALRILRASCDIGLILEESHKVFPFMMAVVDKDLNVMAHTPELLERYPLIAQAPGHIPMQIAKPLLTDIDQTLANTKKGAFQNPLYTDTCDPSDIAFNYNIFVDRKYYARLVVEGPFEQAKDGVQRFVEYLGAMIAEACSEAVSQGQAGSSHRAVHETITKLITGSFLDADKARTVLATIGWKPRHTYKVYLMRFVRKEHVEYYRSEIERDCESCVALIIGEAIYCVRNYSLMSKPDLLEEDRWLKLFLIDNDCKAGVSNPFNGVFQLEPYAKEAELALQSGERTGGGECLFLFKDQALAHLLDMCVSVLPANKVCHPAIGILKDYDAASGSELLETLYAFLDCKLSATSTANRLFIHRTTLIQRVVRIVSLTGLDLDDYDERLHLMLSYRLLKQV